MQGVVHKREDLRDILSLCAERQWAGHWMCRVDVVTCEECTAQLGEDKSLRQFLQVVNAVQTYLSINVRGVGSAKYELHVWQCRSKAL